MGAAIDESMSSIEAYLTELRSTGELRELYPSEAQRTAYHRFLTQSISTSFEAAQAQMPLLSLIRRSVVLHGRGSIQYAAQGDGTSHRSDMMFKTLGTEVEFPRMERFDEIGLNLQLRFFRAEQRTIK